MADPIVEIGDRRTPTVIFLTLVGQCRPVSMNLSECPFRQQLFQQLMCGIQPLIMDDHQFFPRFFGCLLHAFGLGHRIRHRLFTQHMLTGFQCSDGDGAVRLFVRCDDNGIDRSVFPDFLKSPIDFSAVLLLESFCFCDRTVIESNQIDFFVFIA